MKYELVIDEEVIKLPEEMLVGAYQEINKFPKRYENNLQLISLFTGISVMELKNQSVETIELLEGVVGQIIQTPKMEKIILTFTHDGVEYGLENDWSKLAFGAWVDFEVYCSDNIYEHLHKIMAILYRPVISKDKKDPNKYKITPYKSEEIEERAEVMKGVPVKYWLSSAVFFLTLVKIYTDNIKSSLEQIQRIQMKARKGLMRLPKWAQKILSPDSILPYFTNSQKKILQNLNK